MLPNVNKSSNPKSNSKVIRRNSMFVICLLYVCYSRYTQKLYSDNINKLKDN